MLYHKNIVQVKLVCISHKYSYPIVITIVSKVEWIFKHDVTPCWVIGGLKNDTKLG